MLYHNIRVLGMWLMVIDALAIACVSFLSLSFTDQFVSSASAFHVISRLFFSLAVMLCFILVGNRMQAYHARRTERIWDELFSLFEVSTYAVALAVLITMPFLPELSGVVILLTLLIDIVVIAALRLVMRFIVRRWRRDGKDNRVWLIVGSSIRASKLSETITANPHFGVRLLEIVDLPTKNQPAVERHLSSDATYAHADKGARTLNNLEELQVILEENVVDEVIVTLPIRSFYDEIQQIISICRQAGISIKLPPDAFASNQFESELDIVGNTPMVTHYTGPSNHIQLALKRVMDILGSVLGIIVLSPVMLLTALFIKLDSRGKALYFSPRIGLHGREFLMVKFRSMVADAEQLQAALRESNETEGLAFKIKDDPRITRVGRVLRRYHLDELPQLWNVLLGDMSMVGPRPLPEGEAPGEEWWQRRRLSMSPGLTCFWQVEGDHKMPFDQWAQLDLQYIDNWSVWLDVKLIVSTVLVIFRRQGW